MKKVKREAAEQRRPAESERKKRFFPQNVRPYALKCKAFQTENAPGFWRAAAVSVPPCRPCVKRLGEKGSMSMPGPDPRQAGCPGPVRDRLFLMAALREENSAPPGMFLAYLAMRRDLPPRLLEPHLKEIPYGYADSFPQ